MQKNLSFLRFCRFCSCRLWLQILIGIIPPFFPLFLCVQLVKEMDIERGMEAEKERSRSE